MRLEYFELLDHVEEMNLDAGTIRVISTLPDKSTVFDGHFPQYPILPGVLMLEMMNQTAGFLLYQRFRGERVVFVGSIRRARFRRTVSPGAILDARGRIAKDGDGFFVAETSLMVAGEMAADAEIVLIVRDFPTPEARAAFAERITAVTFAEAARTA